MLGILLIVSGLLLNFSVPLIVLYFLINRTISPPVIMGFLMMIPVMLGLAVVLISVGVNFVL